VFSQNSRYYRATSGGSPETGPYQATNIIGDPPESALYDGITRYDIRGVVTADFIQAGFNYAYIDIYTSIWYWCNSNAVAEDPAVVAASYDEVNYIAQRYGILWTVLLPSYSFYDANLRYFVNDYNGNFWWANSAGNLEDPPTSLTEFRAQGADASPILSGLYSGVRYLTDGSVDVDFYTAGYTFVLAFEASHLWCNYSGSTEDPAVSAPNFDGFSAERYGITWGATEYIPA
jgi:hypothetical protein